MLNKNDVLSLRDLALAHLPRVTAQRDEVAKHGRRIALQVVACSPIKTNYDPASTAVELQAARLLNLIHQHPETHVFNLIAEPVEGDDSLCLTEEIILQDAERNRLLIDEMLETEARELCRISGETLPPWMNAATADTQQAPLPTASQAAPAEPKDWQVKALEIANEIALQRWLRGERQITARNISESVATKLGKESRYQGNQGPRSASTVRNEALKGWKFTPPDMA